MLTKNKVTNDADKVVNIIFESIISNRLTPGVKLSESLIKEEFGFSRSSVREGFSKLIHAGILTHKKNQSVRVSYPTKEQTKNIYYARKTIETGIIKLLINKHQNNDLDTTSIKTLIAEEKQLHNSQQQPELTKASCDFHINLAQLCGNNYLLDSLMPLIPLSILSALIYTDEDSCFCSFDEHQKLLTIIQTNDSKKAILAMQQHLDDCINNLNFNKALKQRSHISYLFNQ